MNTKPTELTDEQQETMEKTFTTLEKLANEISKFCAVVTWMFSDIDWENKK